MFYCFDPNTNQWTKIKPFPGKARKGCVSFTLNNKGYIGLGKGKNNKFYKEFYRYDPKSNNWEKITDFPSKPRTKAISFVLNVKHS